MAQVGSILSGEFGQTSIPLQALITTLKPGKASLLDESLLPQKFVRHFLRVAMLAVDRIIHRCISCIGDFSVQSASAWATSGCCCNVCCRITGTASYGGK